MRHATPSVRNLVGTNKCRLTILGDDLATKDWQSVKEDVHVKLLPHDDELYVLDRHKPKATRRPEGQYLPRTNPTGRDPA